ncbi:MAG: NAD-dependent epimerase/dehydratase [Acidobacteria bacterium]|nr:NAD-dependent epimerase/dehydratase [Acidobacteriota bacterium]|tara:strand:- start:3763 stop:4605 length:843 start_codon:yes stop_codon:yes gene_type:complete
MTHLVLGSAGQIGHVLVQYLTTQGETVETFDIRDSPDQDLRLQNNLHLERAFERASYIYFLAYDVGGSRYLQANQSEQWFVMNNLRLMTSTFDMLEQHGKPFLFTSSQMADMTQSTYGALKAVGEHATMSLNGTVVRLWNVYGPERDLSRAHVITDFVLSAINKQKISMRTDGRETRQFLHATDCSRCLHLISQDSQTHEGVSYDVTSFEWTAISSIATIVSKLYSNVPVEIGEASDALQNSVDVEPKRDILKFWQPAISLPDGVSSVAQEIEQLHGRIL